MNNELLTITDLCKELGIGKSTAYKLTRSGNIKSAKIGKHILVTRKALEKYIEKTLNGYD